MVWPDPQALSRWPWLAGEARRRRRAVKNRGVQWRGVRGATKGGGVEGWWAASGGVTCLARGARVWAPAEAGVQWELFRGSRQQAETLCRSGVSGRSGMPTGAGDSGGSGSLTQLVSRGVSIAVHVPRRQWPNANRRGFRRPLGISLDSVSVPAVRFLVAHAAAAWVLLLFPRGLCAQIMHPVGHFPCHSCREADAAARGGERYPGQSAALGSGSAPSLGTCGACFGHMRPLLQNRMLTAPFSYD